MAWIALVPLAVATVAAIVLLGPPVGHLLSVPSGDELWPGEWWEAAGRAEPTKQGRFAIAALAPALLVVAVLVGSRRVALRPRLTRALVVSSQVLLVAFLTSALLAQHPLTRPGVSRPALFGLDTLLPAAAILTATVLALRSDALRARLETIGRETPGRRRAALALAVALVTAWMLEALTTDAVSESAIGLNGNWTLNEAMGVLDGRTPLVDFHPIYAKLLLYPTSVVLSIFGTDTFVYTAFMAALAGLTLLAVYAVFRTVVHDSLPALALFVPFVALTDVEVAPGFSPLTMPATWPMRFGGAYLLAWLTARHLADRRPRTAWVVFFVAGLVCLNSLEFGMAATAATIAGWLAARPPRSLRAVGRLAAEAAVGMLGAAAVVSALTLIRAGALPDPDLLLEWPRIFTSLGWFSMPLPAWELHLAIYATFVACIAVAAVRVSRHEDDSVLTGMLMWGGVFGVLLGGYYTGRPDVVKLATLLSPCAFSLSMLAVVALKGATSHSWRPTLPRLLVLFGIAVSVCTLSGFPIPQEQIARLRGDGPPPAYLPRAERFVDQVAQPGDTVAILLPMSYQLAYDLGIRNVSPYGFMNAIVTRRQMRTLLDTLRDERVDVVFTPEPGSLLAHEADAAPAQLQALVDNGYRVVANEGGMVAFRAD